MGLASNPRAQGGHTVIYFPPMALVVPFFFVSSGPGELSAAQMKKEEALEEMSSLPPRSRRGNGLSPTFSVITYLI